ncbi:F-box protein CPR1-like [Silene latifolia]|uniref:F-box protein CPR1-like n=1 Tax=Silene latifolia TaxID=37657 RepID=UPI003D77E3A9
MATTNDIPHDVIVNDILTRLPAKCLGRCKCVSKAWRSHIENPKFVRFHHDFFNKNESNLSLLVSSGSSLYIMDNFLDDTSPHRVTPLVLPPFASNTGTKIVGSHDGLLCIGSGKTLNNYFVVNPNMPRYPKILPFAQNVFSRTLGGQNNLDYLQRRCLMTPGFGYDHISEAYKLLYIFILTSDRDPQPEGLIYNSKTGSWARLEPPVYVEPPISINQWIFCGELNNSLHFVGERDKNVVITFDLHDEEWGEIKLPCCELGFEVEKEVYELEEGYEIQEVYEVIDACILKGCLSALVIDHGCKYPSFWILKNYGKQNSWTKLFTLPIERNFIVNNFRVLYYLTNKPLVLMLHEGYGVIWYNYQEGNIIEIIEIEKDVAISDARVAFVGGLISVPGARQRQEVVRKGDMLERQRGGLERGKDKQVKGDEVDETEESLVKESWLLKKERAEKKKLKKIEKMEKKKSKNKNKKLK